MRILLLLIAFALPLAAEKTSASIQDFIGSWEGESKCTVPDSPCHDEHVVYDVKAKGEGASIDMYKIVHGEKQFMGTVNCKKPEQQSISCTIPTSKTKNDWVFALLNEKTLDGTLYIDEARTVYRKIHVEKK
jgi:hypothetical protein